MVPFVEDLDTDMTRTDLIEVLQRLRFSNGHSVVRIDRGVRDYLVRMLFRLPAMWGSRCLRAIGIPPPLRSHLKIPSPHWFSHLLRARRTQSYLAAACDQRAQCSFYAD